MGYATTSLSTSAVPGASTPLSVNHVGGKPWSALVTTASSSGTGDFTVQVSMQEPTSSALFTSSGPLAAPTWSNITAANGAAGLSTSQVSAAGYLSLHFNSSTIDTTAGVLVWGSYPIAGIRIASTALSSTTLTLTFLQGVGF
jgi:hypothetical protein